MAHRIFLAHLSVLTIAAVLLIATTLRADTDADKRTAANVRLPIKTRIEACTRLLAAEGLSKTERTWALMQRGNLYRRMDEFDKALADFAKAEQLDPGNPEIHQDRAHVSFNGKRYAEAVAEHDKAHKLDPRHAWSWYVRGRARENLKNYDEALKDYDKALELSPRYLSAYSGRALLHLRRKDYPKAIKDCDGALALDPYYASAYFVRGSAHDLLGNATAALHDHAIALSLNPNLDGPERDLKRLAESATASGTTAGPIPYQAPTKGLSIAYLMTVRTKQAKKSDMEESILELAEWFKKKRVPEPKIKLFLLRQVTAETDGVTTVEPANKYPDIDRRKPSVTTIDYYRSMWPMVFPMGNTGIVLTIELDREPLDALWPLKPGNKGTGGAKLFFIGPDPLTEQAKFLGCKKPGDRVPFGQMKWVGGVVGVEKVVVPAGVFETIVIRVEEEMEIVMMGRSRKNTSTLTWWYAPSVRWWVKRTRDVGDDLIVDEAETIEQ